jgi:thiol-disulfide isomerase/thioredoxin
MEMTTMRSMQTLNRRFALFAAALFALAAAAVAPAQDLQEGKQYVRLKNPAPPVTGPKIEVVEFFSYGCPHCADLEPEMQGWLKSVPPDVTFRRVPVMFQDRWVILGKIYYTLEALGVEQRLSPEVFKAIHKSGGNLATDKAFFDWAAVNDRSQEGRGHVQLVRHRGQDEQGEDRGAAVQRPVGADDRRRRQVHDRHRQGRHARGAAPGHQCAGGQGAGRTAEILTSS